MRAPLRTTAAALGLIALTLAAAPRARAAERVVRVFDEQQGLQVSEISALAQDSSGFVWIGTIGGLFRFDGRTIRRWAPDSMRHNISVLAAGPHGEVLVGGYFEPLYRVTLEGVEPIAGRDGRAIRGWSHATLSAGGGVWVSFGDSLVWRDAHGRWATLRAESLGTGAFYRVMPSRAGGVYAATRRALWWIDEDGARRRIADLPLVYALAERTDGTPIALTRLGGLHEIGPGEPRQLFRGISGGNDVKLRGNRIWATIDHFAYAFDADGKPEIVAPRPGLPSGRPLLVDREGSLWIGGFHGLLQLPEPETVTWGEGDGLPSPTHARFVLKSDEGVWCSTWYGLSLLRRTAGGSRGEVVLADNRWRIVRDGFGRVWTGGLNGFRERVDGRFRFTPVPGESLVRIANASRRPDGRAWLATSAGLFLSPPPGKPAPTLVAGAPPKGWGPSWRGLFAIDVLEDRRGELWLSDGEEIAHAPAESVAAGRGVRWQLERPRDVESCDHLFELADGTLWLGTGNGGVLRRTARGWEEVPGTRALPSRRIGVFSSSPAGGVWLTGAGVAERVEPRPDLPEGWRVLEQLSTWEGVPGQNASEILEEPDGRLWIASLAGLTEVPPSARQVPQLPPVVRLVDLIVDGRRLPLDRPARLPFRRNRIELHFAALSFRDPTRIRYQIRLRAGAPWVDSREPDFRFVDLAPGRYHAEVRASLDGAHWSPAPMRVDFQVLRPWYLEWWAMLFAALALAGALYAAYKIRVAFLLRLERQRARIAMDLHDEMGSGLGSIGLLAGLAADDELDDQSRRRIAAQIADAAGDLGGALADIVWSLRGDSGTLESLAVRLAERGARLFPGGGAELAMCFPDRWPAIELPLEMRRNLQLIAMEALHNAAKHAQARRIELGFAPAGTQWQLWVEDDGRGISEAALSRGASGNGLRNLRARAQAIGADIAWSPGPRGGTRVVVTFDPERRTGRRLA